MAKASSGGGAVARGGQGGRAGKPGSYRKGAAVGSGGQGRKRLEGRGATPPAEMRKGHPAQRRATRAEKLAAQAAATAKPEIRRAPRDAPDAPVRARRTTRDDAPDLGELVVGRNPVVEALRAKVPATALLVAEGIDADERVTEALKMADRRQLPVQAVTKQQLDRRTGRAVHQGIGLEVPPYAYLHPDDLLARARENASAPLLVALDGVTDPRNLGAVVRSAGGFGAHGVLVPERRSAGMGASAWKASAGAAARTPVAQTVNLVRALRSWGSAGLTVVGLDADGELSLDDLELATEPLVVVVGSEGKGLSRLVAQTCDLRVRIPMAAQTESLNAGIAAAVVLAEIARRRRAG